MGRRERGRGHGRADAGGGLGGAMPAAARRAVTSRSMCLAIRSASRLTGAPTDLVAEAGHRERVRDERHREALPCDSVQRQADTVDGDRSLDDQGRRQLGRRGDLAARARRPARGAPTTRPTPSTCPLTRCPPSASPSFSGRSRWTLSRRARARPAWCAPASRGRGRPRTGPARSVTVRQTPSTAMLAPSGSSSTGRSVAITTR